MAQIAVSNRFRSRPRPSRVRLPGFLAVRETDLQGRGIYIRKKIKKNKVIFEEEKPIAFGIAGLSLRAVKSACSNCLKPVCSEPIECNGCNAIGYCSQGCLDEAEELHSIECAGLKALESLRERAGLDPSVEYPVHHLQRPNECFWPPAAVLTTARALNQEALDDHAPKMSEVAKGPPSFGESHAFLVPRLIPLLHPDVNKDPDFLKQVFSNISVCASVLPVVSAVNEVEGNFKRQIFAMYAYYILLNHSCQPNCSYASLHAKMFVYSDEEIKSGEQLSICYTAEWQLALPGEYRRCCLKIKWGFECACTVCTREKVAATRYHQKDQRKRSLVVPWTKRTAEDTMKDGVQGLEEIEKCGSDWSVIREKAEMLFEQQRKVLDEANSIRTLTAYFLVKAYYHQGQGDKALQLAESIRNPVEEYCSPQLISEYSVLVSHCYFDKGHSTQGIEECIRAVKLYPRNINGAPGPGSMLEAIHKATANGGVSVEKKLTALFQDVPVHYK